MKKGTVTGGTGSLETDNNSTRFEIIAGSDFTEGTDVEREISFHFFENKSAVLFVRLAEKERHRNSVRVVMAATIAEMVVEERESEAEKQRIDKSHY